MKTIAKVLFWFAMFWLLWLLPGCVSTEGVVLTKFAYTDGGVVLENPKDTAFDRLIVTDPSTGVVMEITGYRSAANVAAIETAGAQQAQQARLLEVLLELMSRGRPP